ncbi:MAG: hypothetical protein KGN34_14050, partial [Sphingomonadales bacterium]|nr:hypothetical protein [Sphingomonadales bacterium]
WMVRPVTAMTIMNRPKKTLSQRCHLRMGIQTPGMQAGVRRARAGVAVGRWRDGVKGLPWGGRNRRGRRAVAGEINPEE